MGKPSDLGPRMALFFERPRLGHALGMRSLVAVAGAGVLTLGWAITRLFGSVDPSAVFFWGKVVLAGALATLLSGLLLAIGLRLGGWSAWRALHRERRWLKRHAARIDKLLEPGERIHHACVGHIAKTLHDRVGDMLILVTSVGLRVFRVASLGSGLVPIVSSAHTNLHHPKVEGPNLSRALWLFLSPQKGCSVVRLSQVLGPDVEIRLSTIEEAQRCAEALERLHREVEAGPGALALLEPSRIGGELAVAGTGDEGQLGLIEPLAGALSTPRK